MGVGSDVVRVAQEEFGVTLTPKEADWLLWERTAYPFADVQHTMAQVREYLADPKKGEADFANYLKETTQ